jgi:flagellar hook-associated protein 2
MATMSSPGIGTSGLDVKSIISQLVALEKRPLDTLKLDAATTTTKISAFGQIKSLVSSLSDAASKLTSFTGWNSVSASSSDSAFVSASAIGGTQSTNFNVEVQALAKAQSTASGSISGAVGAGTLKIELGSWGVTTPGAGGTFVGKGSAVNIDVSLTDTVADVAVKINGSNAGVTATILTDAGGQRLLLRSKETGLESGFQLTTADGLPGALSRLTSAEITPGATQIAANAKATVNGIAVESATNTFENTVAGVTFKAEKLTELNKPITISVVKDTSAIQANVEAFVKAYNEVNKTLNESTKYDKAAKSIGLLQGDSTALGLQSALRSAMQGVSPGSTVYQRLADIGVVQKTSSDPMATAALGGELTVDTTKLNKALSQNPEEVKKFFRGSDGVSTSGLAYKVKTLTAGMLSSDGFFKSKDGVLQASLKRNEQDQASVNAKVNNFEKRITARYNALDTQMSSLNALNAYVSQQVTSWNKSSG